MFYRNKVVGSIVLTLLIGVVAAMAQNQNQNPQPSRDAGWGSVEDAMNQGLPQTAIERLGPIVDRALAAKAYDEAVKAIAMRIVFEGNIEGNKPEERIIRMKAEIATAPAEMKPTMEAILANWYWQYYQENRWRFMQRTQSDEATGQSGQADQPQSNDDFTTWDLTRILNEIDAQFDRALANAELLQKTPVEQYSRLLEAGSAPATYRPTMFDVLAHNALDFYSAAEQAAVKVQDAFELSADSAIFGSREDFVSWTPVTSDQASPILRAVQLYQALLRFHASDNERSALLDADLYRLQFGNNHAVGDEKRERFKAALRRFEQANATHPISTRALHSLALEVHGEGDLVTAHKIASEVIARDPDSVGAKRCRNLIADIEQPSIAATTERVWNAPWPTIDVEYRNVDQIYLRLVKFDFQEFVRSERWSPEQADQAMLEKVLRQTPVKSWSAKLPKTADYKARTESVAIPSGVTPGSYYLISSHDETFRHENNYHQLTEVWVSDLALVIRDHQGKGLVEGFVLDAKSGQPIRGARIRAWEREPNQGRLIELKATLTDENGMFRFPPAQRNRLLVHVEHHGMSLSSADSMSTYVGQDDGRVSTETRFFTDRAIYRPGQTIHYKGICFSATNKASLRSAVTIVFADSNGKEIERSIHQTNDYGSFSGSVTAPRDRLMGQMSIRVESGPPGQTDVQVEEYKRPKFRVELKAPQEAAKLNAEVKVTGTATAYTGVAISDAKVSWRVVREVQYPIWCWRWWSMPIGESQEIAHGIATTAADGTFSIAFIAKPDSTANVDNEPSFRYTISADVTDTTGETRSDESSVNVGYTALRASMTAGDWLTTEEPVKIELLTTSLDDEGRTAKGSVKIHSLKQPAKVIRASLSGIARPFDGELASADGKAIESGDPNDWELGDVVFESAFETNASGKATLELKLAAGVYRAVLETRDAFGKAVKAILPLHVIDPKATKLPAKLANVVIFKQRSMEPGARFTAVWGSGYDAARAFVEVEQGGKLLQSYWTKPGSTQAAISQEVTESMRGGFHVRVTMVHENRAYLHSQFVDVPWTNKELSIKWERFTSKLLPGQKEKWVAVISGKDAERAAAEMVATLYDASLDAFANHSWMSSFGVFQNDRSFVNSRFQNSLKPIQVMLAGNGREVADEGLTYPRFPDALVAHFFGHGYMRNSRMMMRGGLGGDLMMDAMAAPAAMMPMAADFGMGGAPVDAEPALSIVATGGAVPAGAPETAKPDLTIVSARTNLNETAFFFPHLIAAIDGTVRIEFTMPEALTEWKFLGFAHDTKLRAGLLMDTIVTSKDLMVQPNPPRFLREDDEVEFTVKVSNRSTAIQTGTVRLTLSDAKSMESVDAKLGNADSDKTFEIAAGASQTFSWKLIIPEGIGFLTYKAVGSTGQISDGEEGFLPVLSKRILVTESIALPIRGQQTKQFDFAKLLASGESKTLKHESLTVQMVSNPSWYAVLSLPYLMEYPYECNEQTFSRMYANSLARHIVTSDPKIERVFEQWRGTPALESPLTKNEDLKSVMLEETPWYAEAQDESQARRNVGVLFEQNRLENEISRAMAKLTEAQREDGAWSWFPGGPKNEYMTLYITTGFGRLRHLGVDVEMEPAIKSLATLDAWIKEMRDRKPKPEGISSTIALYLYGRSFFLQDLPIADEHREAVDYWLVQAKAHWLDLPCRQSQAHVAIALKRFGDEATAKAIVASIREHSVSNEEMGMFWRDMESSWWWYHAPIETQAIMIEMFDEVANDSVAVESCKVWLLKQKQTQDWQTTKATADAIYALLLRGSDLLASDKLVSVSLGGEAIVPENAEAGTGFYQERFTRGEVKPTQGSITVTKVDEGVAWGSVHWQYLEDISAVTSHTGTPLTLSKQLFTKQNTAQGPTLSRVDGPVSVGDELVVRIVLKTDRDMEYVHLKDHRGSGTEPVNVLSQYKYQDGLAYYESTRDTASHFFIDYLPKGTYVFEYSTRVQLRGEYQTGVASIQCMYAPEFNSHSESLGIVVK